MAVPTTLLSSGLPLSKIVYVTLARPGGRNWTEPTLADAASTSDPSVVLACEWTKVANSWPFCSSARRRGIGTAPLKKVCQFVVIAAMAAGPLVGCAGGAAGEWVGLADGLAAPPPPEQAATARHASAAVARCAAGRLMLVIARVCRRIGQDPTL